MKKVDEFPDVYTKDMMVFAELINSYFVSKKFDKERPTIAFCYAWADPKDENTICRSIGVTLAECNIQQKLEKIKEILEKIGFTVRMDLYSNDHGGDELLKQLKDRINNCDVRICFLTPLFKEKCSLNKINIDTGKPYIIAEEVKMIDDFDKLNLGEHSTFRFIMAGNEHNSVPNHWLPYLRTVQSYKTPLEALEFMLKKLCLDPDAAESSKENVIFKETWDRFIGGQPKLSSAEQNASEVSPAKGTQVKPTYAASPGRLFARNVGVVTPHIKGGTINIPADSKPITDKESEFLLAAMRHAPPGSTVALDIDVEVKEEIVGTTINFL